MTIAYKGFSVYTCDAQTYEDLTYIGDIELTIIDGQSANWPNNQIKTSLQDAQAAFSGFNPNYSQITAAISPSPTTPALTEMQELLPSCVGRILGATGVKIKLKASNGSYAISSSDVGSTSGGYGLGTYRYNAYNSDNSLAGNFDLGMFFESRGNRACFIGIPNFDGTVPQTASGAKIYQISSYHNLRNHYYYFSSSSCSITADFAAWINAISPLVPPPPPDTDPYAPGGISEPDAGDGTFDFTSQPVDFQGAPSIGAYDTGMITIYVPSAGQLRSLASYLWAGAFDIDNFRKIVADPMDAIIGLSILPVTASEIGVTESTLAVGNISTFLSMPRANRQYVIVDCGTVQILPKWGAYLDFAPYSKLQLFLPYIGFVDISPDDCMNGTISVKYTVDILSGTCVAQVKCKDHVLYEFSGTCSCSCPVTAGQYQNIVLGAIRMAGTIGSMVGSAVTNNIPGTANAITEAANTVLDSVKPAVSRSGGFGGSSGLMGHQFPYLILTVPRLCLPERQNQMIGYPSYVTKTLGDVTGFCKIDVAHLAGIPASEDEQNEILELLKEGVYL